MKNPSKGYSLLEVMIAIALASGLTLVIMRLTEMSSTSQKMVEVKDEIHQLTQEISGTLADRFACKNTFSPVFKKVDELPIMIEEVKDKKDKVLLTVPTKRNGAELLSLEANNFDAKSSTLTLTAKFNYIKEKQTLTKERSIKILMDLTDKGEFEGCVSSTGLLSTDPKEACDYLLGFDQQKNSYFVKDECQFARAVCEKQQRKWDGIGCTFSDEERKAMREESCMSLVGRLNNPESYFDGVICDLPRANCEGIGWSWDGNKCQPPDRLKAELKGFEDAVKKILQKSQN